MCPTSRAALKRRSGSPRKRPVSTRRFRVATTCACSPDWPGTVAEKLGPPSTSSPRLSTSPRCSTVRAKELSGGERRRLHTAIALVGRPTLVLLDEPTVGADVQTRTQLLGVVRGLAEHGAAVVYSTHYFPEVEELGATVAILERGRLLARGGIDEIVTEHSIGIVELAFAGPAPDIAGLAPDDVVTIMGSRVRIETNNPALVTAAVLGGLEPRTTELRGLSVSQPSLETAFLRFTQDRTGGATDEMTDVA